MPQKIFIFSGLGADHRVFHKMNFQEFVPVFIHWIEPLKKETIQNYAIRISKQITEPNPIVLGISFGGIMAIEVSKLRVPPLDLTTVPPMEMTVATLARGVASALQA